MVDAPLTFVDTNVLAYAHDRSETAKQPVARALLETLWRDGGDTWQKLDNENWNAVSLPWIVGPEGRIGKWKK